jgi:contact-dependent growth inhibition (CDI) system CdiI-like immunity protein
VKRPEPSDFPALKQVFAGYLHEDFAAEYGTPASALRTFVDDADEAERRRFKAEVRRFLARTAHLDLDELHALLARMGCRWTPSSHEVLSALLTSAMTHFS